LHLFVSVFVKPPELTKAYAAVSHVEQMARSGCFRGSAGKLGCTSCHDPHEVPAPEQRLSFYRGRCQRCHDAPLAGRRHRAVAAPRCALPAEQRRARQDSCIDCHMPATPTANIVHAALTDHRIPRRTGERPPADSGWRQHELPLLYFHRDLPGVDPRGVQRDLGIALLDAGRQMGRGTLGTRLADAALSKLEPVLREHPQDVAAWEAKGHALWLLGFPSEALKPLETALQLAPDREEALDAAARCAFELNRADDTLAYLQRLRAVNPWYAFAQLNTAKIHSDRGEWAEALTGCREALRLNPADVEARTLLVQCLVRTAQVEQARAEFAILMALKPANAASLRRWFTALQP
jgi:tetratricopeptide (TPR) repeat protein